MTQVPATQRRVVVVDDHAMFRAGVKAEIADQVDVVGEAEDVDTAVEAVLRLRPAECCSTSTFPGAGVVR